MKTSHLRIALATLILMAGLAILVGTSHVLAQNPVGTAFTYQGELKEGGDPADGTYDFQFALYDAATGGAQVGSTLTYDDVSVNDGLFTVELDFGDVFDGNERWLEIAVRKGSSTGAYTTLSPRQKLTATPYALYARRFWRLGGNSGVTTGDYLGTSDNQPLELRVNGQRALLIVPDAASPNLVGGYSGNEVAAGVYGAVIGGGGGGENFRHPNRITDHDGVIGGGQGNSVGNDDSDLENAKGATIGGGYYNAATSLASTVGGGTENQATGGISVVGGGFNNMARGNRSTVSGGGMNVASGESSTVGGGYFNIAGDDSATVGGGYFNFADGQYATVAGGTDNRADGDKSTIGGGSRNVADAAYATIAGGGPMDPTDHPDTTNNVVYDNYGTIGGGGNNEAGNDDGDAGSAPYATVSGGANSKAYGGYSTVSGGDSNMAKDEYATVGGGWINTAGGSCATIAGGKAHITSASFATIGGGEFNQAGGQWATVPGGRNNAAGGDYSFTAGRRAKANNDGCFVWGDATNANITCDVDNRTLFRSSGGYYIYTNPGLTTGVRVSAGGGSWSSVSDRARKENFRSVDAQALLEKLAALEISTWNYKSQDESIRHIGPMAQDFNALLPDLDGEGETYINGLDADGVALAAIQALYQQNRELQAENDELRARLNDLEARMTALEETLAETSPAGGEQ